MKTVRELIARLPLDSQKRIAEMTQALIAEEKLLRESDTNVRNAKPLGMIDDTGLSE